MQVHVRLNNARGSQARGFPKRPRGRFLCLSGLRDLCADLGVGQGLAVEVPRTIDGVDDVDEDLVLGLPAAGHLMDDVCRLLEIALLGLAIGEGKGRYFPLDEATGVSFIPVNV